MSQRDSEIWLASARAHAETTANASVDARQRCFHGQRAVEMSLKAVLMHYDVGFPFTHQLDALMGLVPGGVPDGIIEASSLTPHAVQEMYPDTFSDVGTGHAEEAVVLAHVVVAWAATIIESND